MSKRKPYKAKSITGAQAFVRMLLKQREATGRLLDECWADRELMARLAADGPAFDNPIHAAQAKARRDWILRRCCHLNPDGTRISYAAPAPAQQAPAAEEVGNGE